MKVICNTRDFCPLKDSCPHGQIHECENYAYAMECIVVHDVVQCLPVKERRPHMPKATCPACKKTFHGWAIKHQEKVTCPYCGAVAKKEEKR